MRLQGMLQSPAPLFFNRLNAGPAVHGMFSRQGGVSPPPWDSFNVSYHVGDTLEAVAENRHRLKEMLGLDILLSARQVHGAAIYHLQHRPETDQEVDGFDALLTETRGVGLMIQQADCQAVMLLDRRRPAIGIAHVGWRGSVANILGRLVGSMVELYQSDPSEILAAISPSLGPCCAEFKNFHTELPKAFHRFQVKPEYFDFWQISCRQLIDVGLLQQNIMVAGRCTACDERYFSYRRNKLTGRSASVIALRAD